MKRPWVIEVPILNAVRTSSGPGNSTLTTAAAAMAPRTCDTARSTPRIYGNAPTRHIPSVTAGLKSPPFGVSVAYSRQEIWINERGLRIRSGGLLSDYVLRLKIWYQTGKNISETCVPEMRKNTQALTAREKPKHKLMYRSWAGLEA